MYLCVRVYILSTKILIRWSRGELEWLQLGLGLYISAQKDKSVCVCVCVRACVCVYFALQCVHPLSHYCCLFLHLFASLSTTRSHWGHWTSTPAPIYPCLLFAWVCVCVWPVKCSLHLLCHTTLCPCILHFLSFASSFLHLLSICAHHSILHSMSSWALHKISERPFLSVWWFVNYTVRH